MIPASTAAGSDRFGLGWRRELALGILSHLDKIDVVEVMADDLFDAPRRERHSLRALAAQISVALHGVSLGVASSAPVETERLDKIARLCAEVEPQFWSEHLAFVRGGGIEIGHLTAPPRTLATVIGCRARPGGGSNRSGGRMSTTRFEAFLARIYLDAEVRARFLADPRGEAMRAGLEEREVSALEKIDRIGLELTAQSLQRKRRRRFRRLFQAR